AEIAGQRTGVLDLAAADLAGGLLQGVEQGRQIGFHELGPGRGRAQSPAYGVGGDAAKALDPADIEHILIDQPADARRVEIGPSGKHHGPAPQGGQRLFEVARTEIMAHIVRTRTMPQASSESTWANVR